MTHNPARDIVDQINAHINPWTTEVPEALGRAPKDSFHRSLDRALVTSDEAYSWGPGALEALAAALERHAWPARFVAGISPIDVDPDFLAGVGLIPLHARQIPAQGVE